MPTARYKKILLYQKKVVLLQIEMEQAKVIQRITELGRQILPEGASLWLYGSRARGDARPDSDYDLLILIDKDAVSGEDYGCYCYPFYDLGLDLDAEVSPRIYTRAEWIDMDYIPFHDSVENDKKLLLRTDCEKKRNVVLRLIEKSRQSLAETERFVERDTLDGAIDLLYSAVHSAATALLVNDGLLPKNGKTSPCLFVKTYCDTGVIRKDYGVLYNDVRARYDENNNNCFYHPCAEDIQHMVRNTREMIDTIAALVKAKE